MTDRESILRSQKGIADLDMVKSGSLSEAKKIITADLKERIEVISDLATIIGEVIDPSIGDFVIHNNNQEKKAVVTQDIRRELYIQDEECRESMGLIKNVLQLTFWASKAAKVYKDEETKVKREFGEESLESKSFQEGKEWAYSIKNELLPILSYLLIKDNYRGVKSWGFGKDKKGVEVLYVDYPGYEPFAFHSKDFSKVFPQNLVDYVNNGGLSYPFNYKFQPNQTATRSGDIIAEPNEAELPQLDQLDKPGEIGKIHSLFVSTGQIDRLKQLHNIEDFPKNIDFEMGTDFVAAKYEVIKNELLRRIFVDKSHQIVISRGNNLDINAARYGLQEWWKKAYPEEDDLSFLETRPGEIIPGKINLDNSQKLINEYQGTDNSENETIVIDAEFLRKMGAKSTVQSLNRLGIYFPKQIVELADNPRSNKLLMDPRFGYLYASFYLKGKDLFEFAEEGLLDRELTEDDFKKFHLEEARKEQIEISEKVTKEISKENIFIGTIEEDGKEEKIKVAIVPNEVDYGSYYSFKIMECDYYVSFTLKNEKFQFAILVNRDSTKPLKIPQKIIKQMVAWQQITTDPDSNYQGLFINPNSTMIVAGGKKNFDFWIDIESVLPNRNKKEGTKNVLTEFFKEGFGIE